ncbi:hypothetical protein QE385_004025 [Sphingomonas sp. SORGH_AS 950]|uniref:2OG-Fe(II) oxygenase n=1 Tax=Sphingomonas sp. SORGH_AS_0950 TaxID=3041792 RepID=UPI00278A7DB4|nr:2OG-Fe(II) oxygenase [Sphingomonas sp. SORGH_AS_0950]MDQ1159628.1 hypothetical protein [Sphingomonas sp. SORGH_AS_0950]
MTVFDEMRWHWPSDFADLHQRFRSATPFPHIVLDNIFPPQVVSSLYDEIPQASDEAWIRWGGGKPETCNVKFKKRGLSDVARMPEPIRRMFATLTCDRFVTELSALTGTGDLVIDPSFSGGGVHCSGQGAALRVHADPIRHPDPGAYDQAINLILYINPNWEEHFGGELELWSRDCQQCETSIAPLFNRLIVFQTDRTTFHGHPRPNLCPPDQYRASLAVYYYVKRDKIVDIVNNRPIWR